MDTNHAVVENQPFFRGGAKQVHWPNNFRTLRSVEVQIGVGGNWKH